MKYYKFTLGHRGSEIYPFKLNTQQYNTFQEKRVEFDEMTHDEICEVLGVESYFDSPLDSLMGPYPETFYMKVEDEDGKKTLRRVDPKDIMMSSDTPVQDDTFSEAVQAEAKPDHMLHT